MGTETETIRGHNQVRKAAFLVSLAIIAGAWVGFGSLYRSTFLDRTRDEYVLCREASRHPIIARLAAPQEAVSAAERFATEYERLEQAGPFTAAIHFFEARAAYTSLTLALQGSAERPAPQPTPAPAVPEGSGVTVTSVEAGSSADNAGIQVGDVIVSYNNKPISSNDDLTQARNDATQPFAIGGAGMRRPVRVRRNGVPLDLSIYQGKLGVNTTG